MRVFARRVACCVCYRSYVLPRARAFSRIMTTRRHPLDCLTFRASSRRLEGGKREFSKPLEQFHGARTGFRGIHRGRARVARGQSGDLTASFIEATLNGVEYGLFHQGSDGAEFAPEFAPLLDDHHLDDDFERVRRETFENIFETVLNVTAATMTSTIDEDSNPATPSSNVERASPAATIRIRVRRRVDRRPSKEAALELYDRVASTLGRTRDALRHATATSSSGVAEANLLFAGGRRSVHRVQLAMGRHVHDDARRRCSHRCIHFGRRRDDVSFGGDTRRRRRARMRVYARRRLRLHGRHHDITRRRANDARVAPIHHRPSRPLETPRIPTTSM